MYFSKPPQSKRSPHGNFLPWIIQVMNNHGLVLEQPWWRLGISHDLRTPPFTYIYICVWIFFEIPIRVILYPEVNIRDCRLEMPKSSGKDMAIKFYLEKRVATASIRQRLVVFHVRGTSLIWTLHEGYKFDMWNEDWSDCTPFCHSGSRSHVVFSSPRWATQNLASRWCNGYTSDAVEKKCKGMDPNDPST